MLTRKVSILVALLMFLWASASASPLSVQAVRAADDAVSYEYDTLDGRVATTFDDSATRSYQYDDASTVTFVTYDNRTAHNHVPGVPECNTRHDIAKAAGMGRADQQAAQVGRQGQLTSAREPSGSTESRVVFDYDLLGRLVESTRTGDVVTRGAASDAKNTAGCSRDLIR